ncbi:hypothetical protein ACWDVU_17545 [Streptomyces sp. NPDC003333]
MTTSSPHASDALRSGSGHVMVVGGDAGRFESGTAGPTEVPGARMTGDATAAPPGSALTQRPAR